MTARVHPQADHLTARPVRRPIAMFSPTYPRWQARSDRPHRLVPDRSRAAMVRDQLRPGPRCTLRRRAVARPWRLRAALVSRRTSLSNDDTGLAGPGRSRNAAEPPRRQGHARRCRRRSRRGRDARANEVDRASERHRGSFTRQRGSRTVSSLPQFTAVLRARLRSNGICRASAPARRSVPSVSLATHAAIAAPALRFSGRGSSLVGYSHTRALEEAKLAVPESSEDSSRSGFGANEWLVDEMYERYQKDPDSVDKVWWDFFGKDQRAAAGPPRPPPPTAPQGSPGCEQRHGEGVHRRPQEPPLRRPSSTKAEKPEPSPEASRSQQARDQEDRAEEGGDEARGPGPHRTRTRPATRAPQSKAARAPASRRPKEAEKKQEAAATDEPTVHRPQGRPGPHRAEHGRQPDRPDGDQRPVGARSSCCGTTASSSTTTSPAPAAARCPSPTSSATRWSRR